MTEFSIDKVYLAVFDVKSRYPRKPQQDIAETMTCPNCGGELHYTVRRSDGGTGGKCAQCGLNWQE